MGAFHTYLNTSQTRYNRTLLHRFFAGYKKFPDVTSVQEAMNLNYEKKVHTSTKVHVQVQPWYTYGRVATYCDKTAFLNRLQNVQPNLEATTTLHKYEDFTGNAMRMRNVLFMSFYRNTNTNVRKDSATIAEIKTTFRKREGRQERTRRSAQEMYWLWGT